MRRLLETPIEDSTLADSSFGFQAIGTGGPYTLTDNRVRGNGDGIYVSGNIEILLESNDIESNTYYGLVREVSTEGHTPDTITLINNQFHNNGGYPLPGTRDENISRYDLIIDATDSQPGYTP